MTQVMLYCQVDNVYVVYFFEEEKMKLLTKLAISMVAVASMAQAEVTLIGVDAGVTVLGLRVGGNAALTVGYSSPYGASANASYGTSCGSAVKTVTTTVVHNPCAYVCGPCEVVVPCPAPVPACPVVCDPCAK